jgi:magnesium transporter
MTEDVVQDQEVHVLTQLTDAVADGNVDQIEALLEKLHPADIAHLLDSLPAEQRDFIWPHVPAEHEGEVLLHLNDESRALIIKKMEPEALVAATESLDTDDLADLLPEMPQGVIQELLLTMEYQDRERLRSVLAYPEDSAGGLMDLDTVVVRADTTLDVVFRYLRRRGDIPDTTDSLFVVDREGVLLGVLPFTELLTHDTDTLVDDIMDRDVEGIPATMSAKEVANLFERRDLVTAPVVGDKNKLLGRITIDDVVDVIRDTADQSMMRMAGLSEDEELFSPVVKSTTRRAIWLGINLLTAILASSVIKLFDHAIDKIVALAVLMPIVASMGGIAGSQTLTLVIRGMALGQVSKSNARRLLIKELSVGIANGIIWAVVISIFADVWFGKPGVAVVMGAAIIVNLFAAAFAGTLLPLLLRKFNLDPALSGSVILTTVTDVTGFFVFLGLATLFLL